MSPYRQFARIVCLNADRERARWLRMQARFDHHGIELPNVLVFEDDAVSRIDHGGLRNRL